MSAKKKCEICSENDHKYKCPQCLALYCSLPCYKVHKESCVSKFPKDSEDRSNKPWASSTTTETTLTGRSNELTSVGANLQEISDKKTEAVIKKLDDNKNAPDISDIIGDLVPEDKLKLLGESDKLKEILANKHLRELMMNVDQKEANTDLKMEKLMQEPLFQEFSNTCLNIIQNK